MQKRSHSGIRDHLMVSTEKIEFLKNGQHHALTPKNSKPPKKNSVPDSVWCQHTQRAVRLSVIKLQECRSNVGANYDLMVLKNSKMLQNLLLYNFVASEFYLHQFPLIF